MELPRICAALARAGIHLEHLQEAAAATGATAAEVLAGGPEALAALKVSPASRAALAAAGGPDVDADLRWLDAAQATLVPFGSEAYPPQLAAVRDAPAVLYVLGAVDTLAEAQLAMVGSRSATPVGLRTARDFAAAFARIGLGITSGLAAGIDGASHEGALGAGGLTIAVCGNGLDVVYPPEHRALAERIREHGALVSEFAPGTPPIPSNFPRRNRILSGLALGTLVVEASIRSGSLNTAGHALRQGREVFAIPGSIHSPVARGCHKLIRDGAKLVESADDVLSELQIPLHLQAPARAAASSHAAPRASHALDKDYEMLLDALGFEPASIDVLVERTGLPSESVASMLLILELDGRVAPHAGGRYCRLPEQQP